MTHRSAAPLLLPLTLAGCGKESSSPNSPTPNSPTATSLVVTGCQQSQGFQCVATAMMSSGAPQNVTAAAQWSSSNITVATINAAGVIAALQSGQTDIRATIKASPG